MDSNPRVELVGVSCLSNVYYRNTTKCRLSVSDVMSGLDVISVG